MKSSQPKSQSFPWIPILLTAALLAAFPAIQAAGQSSDAGGKSVTLEGRFGDAQFLAGENVRIAAEVADDVFAAGRSVSLSEAKVGNAIVAGYSVEMKGGSASDVIAAAANIDIGGVVEDDLVAAGRRVRIQAAGSIGDDARIAGQDITIDGKVGGSLRAVGQTIVISGEITGKVDVLAERLVVTSTARIGGDLVHRSEAKAEIAEGATIGGEVRHIVIAKPDPRAIALKILGIGVVLAAIWLVSTLLAIVIVQAALPGLIVQSATDLRTRPWASLGIGLAVFLLGFAVAALFLVSVIGIPIGIPLLLAFFILAMLSYVVAAFGTGLLIRGWLRRQSEPRVWARIGWTVLGALILLLVGIIPIVGWVIVALVCLAAYGATVAQTWRRLRAA